VIDLAVGVINRRCVRQIVDSLVKQIIMRW